MKPIETRSLVKFATILALTFALLFILDPHSQKGIFTYLCTDSREDILVLPPKNANRQYFTRAKFKALGPDFHCYPHFLNYVFFIFDQEQIESGALSIWQKLYQVLNGKSLTIALPTTHAPPRAYSLLLIQGVGTTDDQTFTSGVLNSWETDINDAGHFNNILVRFDQAKFKDYFFSRDRNQIRKCNSAPGGYRECKSYSAEQEIDPAIKNLPDSYENIKSYIRKLREKNSPELRQLYEYLVTNYFKENCSEKRSMLPSELRGDEVDRLIKRGIMNSSSEASFKENNCGLFSEQEDELLRGALQRKALFRPDL